MENRSILLVEDEQIIAFNLKNRLEKLGYTVPAFVANGKDAIAKTEEHQPDLILMDIMLEGDMDGVEAASVIKDKFGTPFMYLTASSDEQTVERAKKTNPLGYLIKPFDENLLRISLEMAFYKYGAEQKIRIAEERLKKVNDCFLAFDVESRENIQRMTALCGELLEARAVIYHQLGEDNIPHAVTGWNFPSDIYPVHNPQCDFCLRVLQHLDEEFILMDASEFSGSCILPAIPEIAEKGSYVGTVVTQGMDSLGILGIYFTTKAEINDELRQIVGIVSSAIRIEENRLRAEEGNRKLQEQLIQSQKLEAIGTMAGGVAHEINNPLMGIINYAQLIVDRLPSGQDTLSEFAGEIIKEGDRIAGIVRDLLSFSRHDQEGFSSAQVGDIIKEALGLAGRMLEKDEIRIDVAIEEGLPYVFCKSQQIEQVILNLLTNARDAMNSRYPGYHDNKVITITSKMYTDPEQRKMVRVDVSDRGGGIPDEIAAKIFDPFFSTKPKHKGTGLGLSVSYGIMNEHSGNLSFDTASDSGTTFHLDLPISSET